MHVAKFSDKDYEANLLEKNINFTVISTYFYFSDDLNLFEKCLSALKTLSFRTKHVIEIE